MMTAAVMTPDDQRLVVLGKQRVVVIDAASGKESGRIESLERPMQVLFPDVKVSKK